MTKWRNSEKFLADSIIILTLAGLYGIPVVHLGATMVDVIALFIGWSIAEEIQARRAAKKALIPVPAPVPQPKEKKYCSADDWDAHWDEGQ